MDFSLSSSLVGSAVSNPDKLALDLQFAADKTLTARKGPTPIFTRASSGTFVGSNGLIQSAGNNVARFDHDPVTLACKGLLIEESRTNLVLRSEAFNITWYASQLNVTGTPEYLNAQVAPDGTLTAELVIGNTSTTTHQFRQDVTLVSGTTYTLSCYFYGTSITSARHASIAAIGTPTGSVDFSARFDALAGTKASPIGFSSSEIQNAGGGWWRCSAVFTAAASGTISFRIGGASSTSITYAGNNTNGIGVWGAQVEAGSFVTSYIPTTTASVIRSADVCSISGSDFTGFWNQTSGTMLEVFEASPNINTTYVSASNGNITQNSIHFDNDTGNMRAVYYSGSSIVATLSLGSVETVGAVNKIASAYSVNDFSASRNGGTVVVDSSGAVPASLSQINIGTDERSQTPVSFYSNRCIGSLRYYKKRLSNSKLQTLTV